MNYKEYGKLNNDVVILLHGGDYRGGIIVKKQKCFKTIFM